MPVRAIKTTHFEENEKKSQFSNFLFVVGIIICCGYILKNKKQKNKIKGEKTERNWYYIILFLFYSIF